MPKLPTEYVGKGFNPDYFSVLCIQQKNARPPCGRAFWRSGL